MSTKLRWVLLIALVFMIGVVSWFLYISWVTYEASADVFCSTATADQKQDCMDYWYMAVCIDTVVFGVSLEDHLDPLGSVCLSFLLLHDTSSWDLSDFVVGDQVFAPPEEMMDLVDSRVEVGMMMFERLDSVEAITNFLGFYFDASSRDRYLEDVGRRGGAPPT